MHIRTANPKGTDPSPTRAIPRGPIHESRVDVEGAVGKINLRVGLLEMQTGGDLPVLQSEDGFDQAGDTGSGIQVADVGFHRADGAEALLLGLLAKRPG